jgi:DNA-binding GntR family transcriptional regulator
MSLKRLVQVEPVREAMLRLTADRLLVNIPQWGYQVREYDIKDVVELYDLRGIANCCLWLRAQVLP